MNVRAADADPHDADLQADADADPHDADAQLDAVCSQCWRFTKAWGLHWQ